MPLVPVRSKADTSAAPKLQVKLARRSPGKRRIAVVISSTSRNRASPLVAAKPTTSIGSAPNRWRAALMQ